MNSMVMFHRLLYVYQRVNGVYRYSDQMAIKKWGRLGMVAHVFIRRCVRQVACTLALLGAWANFHNLRRGGVGGLGCGRRPKKKLGYAPICMVNL
jgi:hypothetical protein